MKIAVIACQVMQREICHIAAKSANVITPYFLPQGLHCTPDILRSEINKKIDEIVNLKTVHDGINEQFSAIVLGYGLCSRGIIDVESTDIPLIVPKTDDCIALFLGSQKRYLEEFNRNSGIYWYNPGWIETSFIPCKENYEKQYADYVEKYGEDNAEFLMEETNGWHSKYTHGCYINSPYLDNKPYTDFAKSAILGLGWDYQELDGDGGMLERLLGGEWDSEEFLTCPPHHKIVETFGEDKIKAVQVI